MLISTVYLPGVFARFDRITLYFPDLFSLWMQLAVYISDKVPEVVIGDPGRFRQIITNLMGNSIKVCFQCPSVKSMLPRIGEVLQKQQYFLSAIVYIIG